MGTFRITAPVWRSVGIALVFATALVAAGCGSSSTSSTSSSTPSSTSSTTTQAASGTSSVPQSPSTLPASLQAPCSALASTLEIGDLQPKNSGNWSAERQRILTDAASNVELFSAAIKGAPADISASLEMLKSYSAWIGTTLSNSSSFDSASSAVNAYPELAGASRAASIVDNWKRQNC